LSACAPDPLAKCGGRERKGRGIARPAQVKRSETRKVGETPCVSEGQSPLSALDSCGASVWGIRTKAGQ